jgi:hypothetical protein
MHQRYVIFGYFTNKKLIFFIFLFMNMKNIGLLLLKLLFSIPVTAQMVPVNDQKLETYVNYLCTQKTSAKDYVLNLFEKYDIVVLCERHLQDMTQYNLIYDIVSDPQFNGGNIYMEIATSSVYDLMDAFLHNDSIPENEVEEHLLNVYRNSDYDDDDFIWDKTNYPLFIKKLYYLNKSLPREKQVNVYPSGVPFSWDAISAKKQFIEFQEKISKGYFRDSVIGTQIRNRITEINKKKMGKKKHLIIMNAHHSLFYSRGCASWWVKKAYPEQTVNVLINSKCYAEQDCLIDDGRWDASFMLSNKNNIGFDFSGNPFGETPLKEYAAECMFVFGKHTDTTKMQDFFHGFVFYEPIENHILSKGYPGTISGKGEFEKEQKRRNSLYYGKIIAFLGSKKIAKYYNTVKTRPYKALNSLLRQRNKWVNANAGISFTVKINK